MTSDRLEIPEFMRFERGRRETSPVVFLEAHGNTFDPDERKNRLEFNRAILESLQSIENLELHSPVLLKVHIGEPDNDTSLRPAFLESSKKFLQKSGLDFFVGDSTVLYSGPRGNRQNGPEADAYQSLAGQRGFGSMGPFVVLDRPATGIPGKVEFSEREITTELDFGGRFKRFFPAGGTQAAGGIINHVHLTLHQFSHFALCVKGLTMGLSGRSGKLSMHQCYHPEIDPDVCQQCGLCVETCPETALAEREDLEPVVDTQRCIGCGECMAACPDEAIGMKGVDIEDWTKGSDSPPHRMVDYLMGLMNGRWDQLVNLAHLYDVTRLCDCVNERQEKICPDMGFLIGQNPFAVDIAARKILEDRLQETADIPGIKHFYPEDTGMELFDYVFDKYRVVTRPEITTVRVEVGK